MYAATAKGAQGGRVNMGSAETLDELKQLVAQEFEFDVLQGLELKEHTGGGGFQATVKFGSEDGTGAGEVILAGTVGGPFEGMERALSFEVEKT